MSSRTATRMRVQSKGSAWRHDSMASMERVLEPELMEDERQAWAYAKADFSDGNSAFVSRFLAEFPDVRSGTIVDLGCGPADIPIRLAAALPLTVDFVGVDGADAMLEPARVALRERGLEGRIR